jgi:hypothetical protein
VVGGHQEALQVDWAFTGWRCDHLLILYFVFKMFTAASDVSNDTNDQQTAPQDFSGQEVDTPKFSMPENRYT